MKTITAFLLVCGALSAQAPQADTVPIYRVTVVARTTKAINYNHRSGSTHIGFRGTALMPAAAGDAKVESKQGVIKIDAEMQKLEPATQFGPEYLTYVMWAITPEGRPTNIGEVLLHDGKSSLHATSELQSFGLIITAEPYFAVTQPSDVVVMENFVRNDTTGTIEQVDAKFELLQRGQYTLNVNPSEIHPRVLNPKVPLELYEARNAVQIARWTGAPRYAADTFKKAEIGLENAEGYLIGKAGKRPIGTVAREAVQMAEDARIITVKKIDEEVLANDRQAGADREARSESARAAAQSETERIARDADAARRAANAKAEADLAEANKLKAEANGLRADNDAQALANRNEADRLKRENDAQRATSQADIDRLAKEKAQAEADKVQLRAQLLLQFNEILQTRDSSRGLIVNMSDVLFDTAEYSLRPAAREKLAKIAGILSGHTALRMQVEGHTDSVGGDDYNQALSEHRAGSVRDYLTQAGISPASVTAQGFGKTQPVATNDTAAGRQQNRRVELVVSGEIIGMTVQPLPVVAIK